jgi:epoxyqueuosine reductase
MSLDPRSELQGLPQHFPELSFRIREEARRLGFFKTGITFVRPLPHPDRFTGWLKCGFHGEMRYMERQATKRLDPGVVIADARSLIAVAMNYHRDRPFVDAPLTGRISGYALGSDYHEVVKNRLELLLQYIREIQPLARGRCYVDTGPIMEKVWGAQTSLGWMGKHTNLIARNHGSWFFIGVILLNLELEYDDPEKDYCGQCIRCLHACPTGALIAPYVLDATRCISYLTIELHRSIPVHLRPLIGNRIYGCDDCQQACPWNRFSEETGESKFHPDDGSLNPSLLPLLRITKEEFESRFARSPILRATRDGFVRNVAVALGNSGAVEAVPALQDALKDTSLLVREHAEWALSQITINNSGS